MPTWKFIIEYSSDKPLLPVNHVRYITNPGYEESNLETLKQVLTIFLDTLQFTPVMNGDSLAQTTPICNRTR
jgi:hypothetical protein